MQHEYFKKVKKMNKLDRVLNKLFYKREDKTIKSKVKIWCVKWVKTKHSVIKIVL